MKDAPLALTTNQAVRVISNELDIDQIVVQSVIDAFVRSIRKALENEYPFLIRGLGKFYFKYVPRTVCRPAFAEYYKDKIHREIAFRPMDEVAVSFNCWVHDFGLKDNTYHSLSQMKIRPNELTKMQRKKTLEEQRKLGFRSELLFDDLPDAEKSLQKELEDSPSVDELVRRVINSLDD